MISYVNHRGTLHAKEKVYTQNVDYILLRVVPQQAPFFPISFIKSSGFFVATRLEEGYQ